MKKICLFALFLAVTSAVRVLAQGSGLPVVTLYSPEKYDHTFTRALFNFETGNLAASGFNRWDLLYGALYAGEEHDWFQVSTSKGSRSAFKDLGALSWTDSFLVPVVEPFPELAEGEERKITIDVSGKDGADGKQGAPGGPVDSRPAVINEFGVFGDPNIPVRLLVLGPPTPSPSFNVLVPPTPSPSVLVTRQPPAPVAGRKRNDGVPKIDPIFVKAVVGHIYVIHVVDNGADYYALFRVESLERGDHCTISWKLIPTPTVVVDHSEKK